MSTYHTQPLVLWTLLFRVGNLRLGLGSVSLMVFKGGSFKDCSGFGPFSRFIADLGCWIITSSFCGTFKIIPTSISRIVPDHRYWQFHQVCHIDFKIEDGQSFTHFRVKQIIQAQSERGSRTLLREHSSEISKNCHNNYLYKHPNIHAHKSGRQIWVFFVAFSCNL